LLRKRRILLGTPQASTKARWKKIKPPQRRLILQISRAELSLSHELMKENLNASQTLPLLNLLPGPRLPPR